MNDINKIQFDEMELNTDLAKEYFKKNNYQFPNDPALSNNKSEKDRYNNTIFIKECRNVDVSVPETVSNIVTYNELFKQERKLSKLAEEVEKNAELFCQIEYLIRNIPIHEVREYDIKLILQYLLCPVPSYWKLTGHLDMGESTPLAYLAVAARAAMYCDSFDIVYSTNTAAVCHLFTELCHSAGLKNIKTAFQESGGLEDKFSALRTGCIGVVTERCDVDSAVDTFLHTTTRYPWKLSRVLVQESVYDIFKKAIDWKVKLKPETVAPSLSRSANCCSSAFAYDGKTFLVDFAGDAVAAEGGIQIEAYRTTKELMSFLESNHALYLSLWASDISQANEIAYNVKSSIVWINSYGVFDGPPQASQAIYMEVLLSNIPKSYIKVSSSQNLLRRQEMWAKLAFEERRRIVRCLTDKFCIDNDMDDIDGELFSNLRCALRITQSDSFARVDKDRICVGKLIPSKFVFLPPNIGSLKYTEELLASALTSGTIVVYGYDSKYKKYFEYLATRIPITPSEESGDEVEADVWDMVRTKVVWTNFGTVFAN